MDDDFWKGAFAPFRKHRLGTGSVENHIVIFSIEYEDFDDGIKIAYISAGFKSGEGPFLFEEEVEGEISEDEAIHIVASQISY